MAKKVFVCAVDVPVSAENDWRNKITKDVPVEVELTSYYLRRIMTGELVVVTETQPQPVATPEYAPLSNYAEVDNADEENSK